MKRRLTKLALFLLLGAVVNVAVAWGCAWQESDQLGSRFHSLWSLPYLEATEVEVGYFVKLGWSRSTDSDRFIHKVNKVQVTDPGFGQRYYYQTSDPRPGITFISHFQLMEAFVVQIQAGWPFGCLAGDVWLPTQSYNSGWTQDPIGIVRIGDNHLLPISVVQSGFFINTILYALFVWLLWLSPFTARRMIRRKRGLCIKCGYDLRHVEHEVCPECGKELSVRTKS